jgi:CO/xanthine dehydrogenase Mo-binding subunit
MRDFPYDAEAREDAICQLIDARTKAIRLDILTGRESTTKAVLERLDIDADEAEARMVVWRAVVCGSSAVGAGHAEAVAHAIFKEAEALAEADVADMERGRAESRDDGRIERATWAQALN